MPECAEKLLQCGGDAAKTVGQSALTVGNILGNIVAHPECAAAMASGNPVAVGVTGLVVGLGAAGVVGAQSCEADIYGAALAPVSAGVDAVLQTNMSSRLQSGESFDVIKGAIKQIPAPGLPPDVGGLIGCGCGALEAGAQAVEDVRKVAKFAAATYESCGAAVNACPGLKQVVAVLKVAYQVVTDPSSIVQSCDSMSRRQYVDARLRDLIQPTVDQFKNNIPWAGSNIEVNHWNPRLKTCYKYYDSHCYKEDEARDFCNGPVWDENFDPDVWAAITAEFNGPQFDLYWNNNVAKVAPKAVCPADPGGAVINFDPNVVGAIEQKKAAQSANAKACQATMAQLVNGKMRVLAHDLLPATREGWNNDVRLKQTEKPLDNARKVFLRAMTAAAVVARAEMAQAQAKYAAEDTAIANAGDLAATPYVVLNKKYGEWATIVDGVKNNCPKDPNGYEKKYDLQCVKDVAASLGMSAQDTATLKLDGQIVGIIQANLANGSFAGSRYYNTASDMLLRPGKVPRIRTPGETAAQATARYTAYWAPIEGVISTQFGQDMPGILGKAFERVEAEKSARKQQDASFAALAANNKIEGDYALTVCDKAKDPAGAATPKSIECRNKVDGAIKDEASKFGVSQYKVFPGGFNPAKPAAAAVVTAALADIRKVHDAAAKSYDAIHKQMGVDPARPPLKDVQANVIKAATTGVAAKPAEQQSPGAKVAMPGTASGGQAPAKDDLTRKSGLPAGVGIAAGVVGAGTPESGQARIGIAPGGNLSAVPPPGVLGSQQRLPPPSPTQPGRVGMPGLPTMGALPAGTSRLGVQPGIAAVTTPPPATGPATVAMPPAGNAGADVVLNKQPAPGAIPGAVPGLVPGAPPAPLVGIVPPPAGSAGAGMVLNKPDPGAVPGVAAALAPPFNAQAFRVERVTAIGEKWLPQCKGNAACTQGMEAFMKLRIATEVQALTAGSPDYRNKAAVAAYIAKLDTEYDPQFMALIPKPAMVAPTSVPPVPLGTPPPKPPPKIQKIPGVK